jgi:hypothetical protein
MVLKSRWQWLMYQTLSSSLYKDGYRNIQNIDFSERVIEKMSTMHSDFPEMTWDVRGLSPTLGLQWSMPLTCVR